MAHLGLIGAGELPAYPVPGMLAGWETRVGLCPSRMRLGLFLLSFQTPLHVHPGVHSLHVNLPSRDQAWWQDLALIICE